MELIPIRLILDNAGNLVDKYTLLPVVNQYATNYKLEVAFLNDMPDARLIKVVFEINGKSSPARILSPTLLRINLGDTYSYYSHEYQLTQYETQFFQDELAFNVYVYNSNGNQISSVRISLPMTKQMFSKLTPAGLDENDGSLSSITKAIYDLESAIINKGIADTENFETKTEALEKLDAAKEYTDAKIYESQILIKDDFTKSLNEKETQIDERTNTKIAEHNFSTTSHSDIRNILRDLVDSKDDIPPNVYNKNEVDIRIENALNDLIDSSPDALNTLRELSAAIGNDPNFATTVLTEIGKKLDKNIYNAEIPVIKEDITDIQERVMNFLKLLDTKLDKTSVPTLRIWR